MTDNELIKQIMERNRAGKAYRAEHWEPLWEAAGQFVQAQTGSMISGSSRVDGEKRGMRVYDGTPESAKDIMVAGLYSGWCPDNYKWFRWSTVPLDLSKMAKVKNWLSACEDITYLAINDSNYGDATFSCFEQQVSFGTGVKYAESSPTKLLNFQLIDLIECVFFENEHRIVDTMFRECSLTARNAIARWGVDKMPAEILRADESGNKEAPFKFLHAIFPREDYDTSKRDRLNMPFRSLWIYPEKSLLMNEGGYRDFPYSVPRMYKQGNERYGRGPAIKALSDMGVLNQMGATNLTAGQRMVEPALQVPDDGYTKAVDLSPGALNFLPQGKGEIKPIVAGLNVPFGLEMQDRQEKAVQRWFHVDVFLALTMADSRMTATEIMERKQEKLQLLGPTIGRQKREHQDSDLDRIFSILYENNYFPPPPEEVLQYMDRLQTEYTSPLYQAQMRRDSEAIISVYSKASMIVQATGRPDALDRLNDDKAMEIISDRENLPVEVLVDQELASQVRAKRQQQQQAMQQAQASMSAVEAAKSLGQTPMDPGQPNAMTQLMGMKGGAA